MNIKTTILYLFYIEFNIYGSTVKIYNLKKKYFLIYININIYKFIFNLNIFNNYI